MSENLSPDVIAEIVRQLARAFPVPMNTYERGGLIDEHDAATLLGGISYEDNPVDELGFMVKMGLLKTANGGAEEERRFRPADLLAFLEQHGEAWYLARLEMAREALRSGGI
ncbi:MAG: hypothetical protein IPJ65_07215 [Archangiaceae bacterium]|nr:hypothetical protein [Archangiaceae bacterium]